MKTTIYTVWVSLLLAVLASSCSSEKEVLGTGTDYTQTINQIQETTWTYFSFATRSVVGISKLGSEKEEAAWKARTDWDIAFCGKFLKTNSGTSGVGNGGLLKIEGLSYELITKALPETFEVDTEQ